ncbi:MAG: hypothetical protein KF764_22590 [Labilithrix sp.]|nr:hypothetical protein [Labilithrix sp.]
MKVVALAFVVSALSAFANGCAVPASEEAERFREALPLQQEVALRVPGAANATNATKPKSGGLRIATGTGAGATARYYQFTRDLTGAVDFGTAVILGGIWAIVHSAPTTLEPKKAVWGPGAGNALEPAVWRFTVNEVGDAEYDYVLEGQPKAGGAWLSVMKGHGYGKSHPEHKQGWFEVDNDAYKTLEPTRGNDEGKTKVTYDLKQLPATIAVELRPDAAKGWADVKVTHDQAGSGSVEITSLGDIDESKATALEDIHLLSRWTSEGSGRADISMSNGDLPFTVDATECWSSSFARVYYKDTVDFEPNTGDASVCAFTQAPSKL